MSKKPQPQKKDQSKNKPQIVDQQNELFLVSLKKKVRTINKRLTEIAELEAREDLKPEQVEKVNRKESLEAEKERVEEYINLYRQHLIENAESIRELQHTELARLARGIAVLHSETSHESEKEAFGGKLNTLWSALSQNSRVNEKSLSSYINSINSALSAFANDSHLQEKLTNFAADFGQDSVNVAKTVKTEQKAAEVLIEKPVQKPQVPQKSQTKVEKSHQEHPQVVAKTEPIVEPPAQVTIVNPVVESVPVEVKQEVVTQEVQPTEVKTEGQKTEEKGASKEDSRKDGRQHYRGRGGYRGNNRDGNRGEPRQFNGERRYNNEKKSYRPKNETQKREEGSDSDQSIEETRNFRRQEIQKLEEEGFTVVGKPKPKAKDQKEQRQFHENQHGKKSHHHGHPN